MKEMYGDGTWELFTVLVVPVKKKSELLLDKGSDLGPPGWFFIYKSPVTSTSLKLKWLRFFFFNHEIGLGPPETSQQWAGFGFRI